MAGGGGVRHAKAALPQLTLWPLAPLRGLNMVWCLSSRLYSFISAVPYRSVREERRFLTSYGVDYDPRYLLGRTAYAPTGASPIF
jgi:hypothetical protein